MRSPVLSLYFLRAALVCAGSFPAVVAAGAEQQIDCPLTLDASSFHMTETSMEWTPFVPAFLPVRSASVNAGPAARAGQAPSLSTTKGNRFVQTWNFEGSYPAGKWISCGYGRANQVLLSKRLDDATSQCVVATLKKPGGAIRLEIRCQGAADR